jgi:hypothetical protein
MLHQLDIKNKTDRTMTVETDEGIFHIDPNELVQHIPGFVKKINNELIEITGSASINPHRYKTLTQLSTTLALGNLHTVILTQHNVVPHWVAATGAVGNINIGSIHILSAVFPANVIIGSAVDLIVTFTGGTFGPTSPTVNLSSLNRLSGPSGSYNAADVTWNQYTGVLVIPFVATSLGTGSVIINGLTPTVEIIAETIGLDTPSIYFPYTPADMLAYSAGVPGGTWYVQRLINFTSNPMSGAPFGDTHISSDWRYSLNSNGSSPTSIVTNDILDLTSWQGSSVPGHTSYAFAPDTTYYVQVRYHSFTGLASLWSDPRQFHTNSNPV